MPELVLSALLALAVTAAVVDLRTRTIPHTLNLAVLGVALGARVVGWTALPWASIGLGLAVGFAIPACLFFIGVMGGGDVKLLAALGAGVGLDGLLSLLYWTTITGGVIALPLVIRRRLAARRAAADDGVNAAASGAADEGVVRDAAPTRGGPDDGGTNAAHAAEASSPDGDADGDREMAYAPAIAVGLALAWLAGDLTALTGATT